MGLDNTVLYAGIVAEAAVIGLLLYRRVWRTLPVFCIYLMWGVLSDLGISEVRHTAGLYSHTYLITYLTVQSLDSVIQFAVLIELGWSILRPLRASLSSRALILVVLLIVALGAAIWPFASVHGMADQPAAWRNIIRLQQTASILRVLFFLLLAAGSQLLSIGWRDRELQIATGLGFYSLVSLAVDILHQHQAFGPNYASWQQLAAVSYLCSLLYWVFSFAQQEAERREFTPQMQNFLLAVAGTARASRIALDDANKRKDRNRHE